MSLILSRFSLVFDWIRFILNRFSLIFDWIRLILSWLSLVFDWLSLILSRFSLVFDWISLILSWFSLIFNWIRLILSWFSLIFDWIRLILSWSCLVFDWISLILSRFSFILDWISYISSIISLLSIIRLHLIIGCRICRFCLILLRLCRISFCIISCLVSFRLISVIIWCCCVIFWRCFILLRFLRLFLRHNWNFSADDDVVIAATKGIIVFSAFVVLDRFVSYDRSALLIREHKDSYTIIITKSFKGSTIACKCAGVVCTVNKTNVTK